MALERSTSVNSEGVYRRQFRARFTGQYVLLYLGLHVLFILPFTGQYSSNIDDIMLAHPGGVA